MREEEFSQLQEPSETNVTILPDTIRTSKEDALISASKRTIEYLSWWRLIEFVAVPFKCLHIILQSFSSTW